MKARSRVKDKRLNISCILNNLEWSVFDGVYLHYFNKQLESEESITVGTKLRQSLVKLLRKKRI